MAYYKIKYILLNNNQYFKINFKFALVLSKVCMLYYLHHILNIYDIRKYYIFIIRGGV